MKTKKFIQNLKSSLVISRITSLELGMLIILLLVTTGIWGFIELADEVLEGETRRIDEWLSWQCETPPIYPILWARRGSKR